MDAFSVRVRTLTGKSIVFTVTSSMTIEFFSLTIQEKEGYPAERIVLLALDERMHTAIAMVDPKRTLKDYGVHADHSIVVTLRRRPLSWSESNRLLNSRIIDMPKRQVPLVIDGARFKKDVQSALQILPCVKAR